MIGTPGCKPFEIGKQYSRFFVKIRNGLGGSEKLLYFLNHCWCADRPKNCRQACLDFSFGLPVLGTIVWLQSRERENLQWYWVAMVTLMVDTRSVL